MFTKRLTRPRRSRPRIRSELPPMPRVRYYS